MQVLVHTHIQRHVNVRGKDLSHAEDEVNFYEEALRKG